MQANDLMVILPIAAGVVSGIITIVGLIAEKTKNTTDDKIVHWARLIWSFIPIGQMDPKQMGWKKEKK